MLRFRYWQLLMLSLTLVRQLGLKTIVVKITNAALDAVMKGPVTISGFAKGAVYQAIVYRGAMT